MSFEVINPKPEDRAEVLSEEGKGVQAGQKKERILTPREQERIDEFKAEKLAKANTREELKELVLKTQRGSLEEKAVREKMKMLKEQEEEDKRKKAKEMEEKDNEIKEKLDTLLGGRNPRELLNRELESVVLKTKDIEVLKELIFSVGRGEQERIIRERIEEIEKLEK